MNKENDWHKKSSTSGSFRDLERIIRDSLSKKIAQLKYTYDSVPDYFSARQRAIRKVSRAKGKLERIEHRQHVKQQLQEKYGLPKILAHPLSKFAYRIPENEYARGIAVMFAGYATGGFSKRYRDIVADMYHLEANDLTKYNIIAEAALLPLSLFYLYVGERGISTAIDYFSGGHEHPVIDAVFWTALGLKAIQPAVRWAYFKATKKHMPNITGVYSEIFPVNLVVAALFIGDFALRMKNNFKNNNNLPKSSSSKYLSC